MAYLNNCNLLIYYANGETTYKNNIEKFKPGPGSPIPITLQTSIILKPIKKIESNDSNESILVDYEFNDLIIFNDKNFDFSINPLSISMQLDPSIFDNQSFLENQSKKMFAIFLRFNIIDTDQKVVNLEKQNKDLFGINILKDIFENDILLTDWVEIKLSPSIHKHNLNYKFKINNNYITNIKNLNNLVNNKYKIDTKLVTKFKLPANLIDKTLKIDYVLFKVKYIDSYKIYKVPPKDKPNLQVITLKPNSTPIPNNSTPIPNNSTPIPNKDLIIEKQLDTKTPIWIIFIIIFTICLLLYFVYKLYLLYIKSY